MAPDAACILYNPAASVVVPTVVPFTVTETSERFFRPSLFTVPETVCACEIVENKRRNRAATIWVNPGKYPALKVFS